MINNNQQIVLNILVCSSIVNFRISFVKCYKFKKSLPRLAVVWFMWVYTILVTQIGRFDKGHVVNLNCTKIFSELYLFNIRKCEID